MPNKSNKSKSVAHHVEKKNLTLGDLVEATYSACGSRRAKKLLQLALESHMIRFQRSGPEWA
jgi:hypothetical protein